jgi:hypothetical protein
MNTSFTYNLLHVPGVKDYLESERLDPKYDKYYSVHPYSTKANEKYTILRYNKELLSSDLIDTYGLVRSVIISGKKIVGFSPPKSMSADHFMKTYPVKTDTIVAEEFVEGTMINLFYDTAYGANGCWQIATRNTVGADITFHQWSRKTFHDMFIEACAMNHLSLHLLNRNYCYSFVLQHPENKIVVPFKKPQLYLVTIYEIFQKDGAAMVVELDIDTVRKMEVWQLTDVRFPEMYEFTTYSDLLQKFASPNTSYDILGVIVKNKVTGQRTKFRNPIYEEVRYLRGNQPKLQYQYLTLRHSGQIAEFLKFFPEKKQEMSQWRDQVHLFTNTLHKNYLSCYVKKEKQLTDFSSQYRSHLLHLHQLFIHELRPKKLAVTNTVVIKYVNDLNPSLLMYGLNYNIRKRALATKELAPFFKLF